MKKLILIGAVVALVTGVVVGPGAEAGGRIPSTVPQFGLYLQESFDLNLELDNFYANASNADSDKILRCKSAEDEICLNTTNIMMIHNLPVCAVDDSFDCIKAVWAVDSTGKKIEGQYQTALPAKGFTDRDAIPSLKLSAARGFGGLWKIPGVVNSGGEDNYFVSARSNAWINKGAGEPLNLKQVGYGPLMTGIIPVKKVLGNYPSVTSRPTWGRAGDPGNTGPVYTPDNQRCTVTDVGFCELPQDFPDGYRFGMSVKLSQPINGWFHGRIARPLIDITPSGNGKLIAIEAEPVKISTLDFMIPNAQVPESVRKVIFADVDWGIMGSPNVGMQTMLNGLDDPQTMKIMNEMLPTIGDKATKTTQYWSYRTLTGWNNADVTRCQGSGDQVGGVVNTNALTYSSGPPTYNKETGTLEYKVASPHYEADGKIALGTYDLAVKSDVARCIYGFTSAPINATIQIVNESGEQKVATIVVNERNGWLYLSAKGFTFSSPTIKVKLTQDAPAKEEVKPVAVAKKSSITCVKGKATKVVNAVSPRCPSGYKKK